MENATFWKLTTAVFAATTVILLLRENESEVRPPVPDARAPAAAGAPADLPSPRDEPSAAEPGEPATQPEPLDPDAMAEDPVSLARRAFVRYRMDASGPTPKRLQAALEARRDEILPVLDDWIRRADELGKGGIDVGRILSAYPRLAGADAIPLLSECLLSRAPPLHEAARALLEIDDPKAVDVLRSYQRALPPDLMVESPQTLWRRGGRWRDLVREWGVNPPPGQPRMRTWAREAIFRLGSEEEREEVWRTRDGEPREEAEFLWTKIDPRWPSPWPGRARAEAIARLESEDPWTRLRGMNRVVADPENFEPEVLARVEVMLRADLEAERPAGVDSQDLERYRESLRRSLEQLERRRREAAQARKLDELLRPR